jgi:hypothetical protein
MAHRNSIRIATSVLACGVALAALAPVVSGQGVIVSTSPKVSIGSSGNLPISDNTVRSMIDLHFPEALTSDADAPQMVMLVIDANNEFVSGKARTAIMANVLSAGGEGSNGVRTFVIGDSAAAAGAVTIGPASIMIRRDTAGAVALSSAAGPVFSVIRARTGEGEVGGVMGSDYNLSDISSINLRRFPAGQLGTSAVIVSVLKLK